MVLDEHFKSFKKKLSDEKIIKIWIKTLVSAYKNIPEIIRAVDKVIEAQASTISFGSSIFNSGSKSTLDQVERVIDLSERKRSLTNVFLMTKSLLSELEQKDYQILEQKFFLCYTLKEIAAEQNVSVRTVYRKINKILDELYFICLKNRWSKKFIETQVQSEHWLIEKNNRHIYELYREKMAAKKLKIYS